MGCPDCQVGRFFKGILTPHLDEAVQAMGQKLAAVSLAQLYDEWVTYHQQAGLPPFPTSL